MPNLQRIELMDYTNRPFATFCEDPLLVCESEGRANAMTIGWGGLGTLWSQPVGTVYVRTSRFTHQLLSCSSLFSVCWMPAELKAQVAPCGTESGRDGNKIAACGLTLAHTEEGVPYLAEASTVVCMRKIHMAPIDMLAFCQDGMYDRWYQPGTANSPHVEAIGRVLAVLQVNG